MCHGVHTPQIFEHSPSSKDHDFTRKAHPLDHTMQPNSMTQQSIHDQEYTRTRWHQDCTKARNTSQAVLQAEQHAGGQVPAVALTH